MISRSDYQEVESKLNEKELEIDNLKTIIIALNQKVKAKDDLEQELGKQKEEISSLVDAR